MPPREFPPWERASTAGFAGGASTGRGSGRTGRSESVCGPSRVGTAAPARACGGPAIGQNHGRGRSSTRLRRGGKKVRGGRKRHLPVDTEGLASKAKVHSGAKVVPDQDGISRLPLEPASEEMSRPKHHRLDAPDTRAGAGGGPRRFWARASRSCASHRSRFQRRSRRSGPRDGPKREEPAPVSGAARRWLSYRL